MIKIYTDGACKGNPGPGGWGYVVYENGEEVTSDHGAMKDTTNNRMEMLAMIYALEEAVDNWHGNVITIYTDSAYIHNCLKQKWYIGWRRNGWKNSKKQPVKNKELWKQILDLIENSFGISIEKVKGHSGIKGNERADQLATKFREVF